MLYNDCVINVKTNKHLSVTDEGMLSQWYEFQTNGINITDLTENQALLSVQPLYISPPFSVYLRLTLFQINACRDLISAIATLVSICLSHLPLFPITVNIVGGEWTH